MNPRANGPQRSDETPSSTCLRLCKCSAASIARYVCERDDMETERAIISLRRMRLGGE